MKENQIEPNILDTSLFRLGVNWRRLVWELIKSGPQGPGSEQIQKLCTVEVAGKTLENVQGVFKERSVKRSIRERLTSVH